MVKRYYSVDSLWIALGVFEKAYGIKSKEFYERLTDGLEIYPEVPNFDRSVWASVYRDYTRLVQQIAEEDALAVENEDTATE